MSKEVDTSQIKYATAEKGKTELEAHDKEYMEMTLHSGDHGEIVQKLMRQRIQQRALEWPRWPASYSTGTRLIWIESRFWYDRERLGPDFDQDWREYRAKYLHSLTLDPREPVHVPEYERELLNPIRRFYMKPGDWLENKIIKRFTQDRYYSAVYRTNVSRFIMVYMGMVGLYYYLRYNHNKWYGYAGPKIIRSKPDVNPDHPKYPFKDYKTEPSHHADGAFSRRTIFRDLRDYEDRTVML